jgi:hypothetical protein
MQNVIKELLFLIIIVGSTMFMVKNCQEMMINQTLIEHDLGVRDHGKTDTTTN